MNNISKIVKITVVFLISILFLSGCNPNSNMKNQGIGTVTVNGSSNKTVNKNENDQEKSNTIPFKTYTLSQLQDDFHQFQITIEVQHSKLYTNQEELSQLFKTQYLKLHDNMDEIEFYRILSPIVAKLNCGHTSINFSEEFGDYAYKNGKYLPLIIKIIDDRAYIYQSLLSSNILAGSEVLSINGKKIKDIIKIFLDNIPADGSNTSKKYYTMNNWFNNMYFNYIDSPENFSITYNTTSGNKNLNTTISSATKEQIDNAIKNLNPSKVQDSEPYSSTFEKDYAVLTIKSFAFYDDNSRNKFKAFIDDFFSNLTSKKIPSLILDLRDNWGGDPYCSSYLFSYLIKEAKPYFSSEGSGNGYYDLKQPIMPAKNNYHGKLYTLINGASFSSTGHLCSLLKFYKIGTFFGEESGGSFICTDGSQDTTLNNTKLRFHYSTTPWKVAVSGLTSGSGIIPDHVIVPTIQDYLNEKDVVKEFAIGLIKGGK